jgi:hypothetical protein
MDEGPTASIWLPLHPRRHSISVKPKAAAAHSGCAFLRTSQHTTAAQLGAVMPAGGGGVSRRHLLSAQITNYYAASTCTMQLVTLHGMA